MAVTLPLTHLNERLVCILSFPRTLRELAIARIVELWILGIREIISEGRLELCGIKVIGKGTNSVVFKARHESLGTVLVKALRVDSPRTSLLKEARILQLTNRRGVGPKLYFYTRSFLVEEYVEGEPLHEWVKKADTGTLRRTLRSVIDQLHALDAIGVSHGELSRPGDHILVTKHGDPVLIDFESASLERSKSILTQFMNALLFADKLRLLRVKLGLEDAEKESIISVLRAYKKERSNKYVAKIFDLLDL